MVSIVWNVSSCFYCYLQVTRFQYKLYVNILQLIIIIIIIQLLLFIMMNVMGGAII